MKENMINKPEGRSPLSQTGDRRRRRYPECIDDIEASYKLAAICNHRDYDADISIKHL
jgi:hypothetical protein